MRRARLAVLVLDWSEPMRAPLDRPDRTLTGVTARSRAEAVDAAARATIVDLQGNPTAGRTHLASVTFHEAVAEVRPPRPLPSLRPGSTSFAPTSGGAGGPRIDRGLAAARDLVAPLVTGEPATDVDGAPLPVTVVVVSGGACRAPQRSLAVAAAVRNLPATGIACAFLAPPGHGRGSGPRLLQAMASSPARYRTVSTAEGLRAFLTTSLAAPA